MNIKGYKRENGTYGVRNHLVILPTSVCASETASRIAQSTLGAVALPHTNGCCQVGVDYLQTVRTLIGLGKNPNVGGVLVVGLGCEGVQADVVAKEIEATGKLVETLIIQEHNGTLGAVREGCRVAVEMSRKLSEQQKVEFDISNLTLALECGGSDPTSGIASNPVQGKCSDMLIAAGGSSILSETTEMIGAEYILADRAETPEIREEFLGMVARTEHRAIEMGEDLRGTQPTPGNIEGGLSTIEEKSLGCIYKAGSAPLRGVLKYGQTKPLGKKGLFFMDSPGQDIESITGMVAAGAQVVLFTTGRGTPTGCPIAPVIKITGNNDTYHKMIDNIDINAGRVIVKGESIESIGKELFDEMIKVANGKATKAESLMHREFGIFRVGYTF